MSAIEITMVVLWIGLTAYVLFGGADFGGGVWDLLAGDSEKGKPQRNLIEHSIGPVWEANHVWLIFVIVMMWTGIPSVFAALCSTLYIPLTLVALGIIARGSAFVFRKVSIELHHRRLFGATFAFSSVVTPYFLGTVAGAVASGRVPAGIAQGDIWGSWLNPTSTMTGLLTVVIVAYLAAVFLTRDAERDGLTDLAEVFRRRAILAGLVLGVLSAATLFVVRVDAPQLFDAMMRFPALVLVLVAAVSGILSIVLLRVRRFLLVRLTAALAVSALLWGWGAGQFPFLLPGVTMQEAAATDAVLHATLITLAVGSVFLVPALWLLYRTFQQGHHEDNRAIAHLPSADPTPPGNAR